MTKPPTSREAIFVRAMIQGRNSLGLTQNQFARRLSDDYGLRFHQQTIQRIETGQRPLRLDETFAIAEVLGSDVISMCTDPGGTVPELLEAARQVGEALAAFREASSGVARSEHLLSRAVRRVQDERQDTPESEQAPHRLALAFVYHHLGDEDSPFDPVAIEETLARLNKTVEDLVPDEASALDLSKVDDAQLRTLQAWLETDKSHG